MAVVSYRAIADDLRNQIVGGRYAPGDTIPKEIELAATYQVNRTTVRRAIAQLRGEGLVTPVKRRGTVVRDRTPVSVPFTRYGAAMNPGGGQGPWEAACARQGLDGRAEVVEVGRRQADDGVAGRLQVPVGTVVVHRKRHMWAGAQVAQVQEAWIPLELIADSPLAEEAKVVGGVYAALTALGHRPASVDESVRARMPTPDEAGTMGIEQGTPVLVVERVTRGAGSRPLEFLRAVAVGDRVQLLYDGLPLDSPA